MFETMNEDTPLDKLFNHININNLFEQTLISL